jgi:hypothetical protein
LLKGKKEIPLVKKKQNCFVLKNLYHRYCMVQEKPVHFAVPFSELRQLVYTPHVYLIDLDIDGTVYSAIVQDLQWHAVEEQALHVDFLRIEEKQKNQNQFAC